MHGAEQTLDASSSAACAALFPGPSRPCPAPGAASTTGPFHVGLVGEGTATAWLKISHRLFRLHLLLHRTAPLADLPPLRWPTSSFCPLVKSKKVSSASRSHRGPPRRNGPACLCHLLASPDLAKTSASARASCAGRQPCTRSLCSVHKAQDRFLFPQPSVLVPFQSDVRSGEIGGSQAATVSQIGNHLIKTLSGKMTDHTLWLQ
jgi:hypothetical protein